MACFLDLVELFEYFLQWNCGLQIAWSDGLFSLAVMHIWKALWMHKTLGMPAGYQSLQIWSLLRISAAQHHTKSGPLWAKS